MVHVTALLRIDEVRVNLEGTDGEHLALRAHEVASVTPNVI